MQNILSTSGTLTCISGSDAYAPQPYWDTYTHRQLTQNEIDGLINNNYFVNVVSLSPGEYTCLEISFNDPVYIGHIRMYGDFSANSLSFDTLLKQSSKELSQTQLDANLFNTEDIKGVIGYWDSIDSSTGYFCTAQVEVIPGIPELVSASGVTVTSGNFTSYIDGVSNKSIRQVVYMASGVDSVRLLLDSLVGYDTVIKSMRIATVDVQTVEPVLSQLNTQDHDVRSDIRYWIGDNTDTNTGHFEGARASLAQLPVTGTWDEYVSWSGTKNRIELSDKGGSSFRQIIPYSEQGQAGDGIRVTLSGSDVTDVTVDRMSFMLARSEELSLSFDTELDFLKTDLKEGIYTWKQDDGHYGHFEGPESVITSGTTAVMYSANVIGITAEDHGFDPGDYIRIDGTVHYDGYYFVLEFHHTNDHFTIWGIYDYEMFGGDARVRQLLSIGTDIDEYGQKRDVRDVVPYSQVNFSNTSVGYILNYSNSGRSHKAVHMGPDEYVTDSVVSIYDLTTTDRGWLSNTPGPGVNPRYFTDMPDMGLAKPTFEGRQDVFSRFLSMPNTDPAYAYTTEPASSWSGDFFVISDADDPELEGDWTGWKGMSRFFDRRMSQPWYVYLNNSSDCIWITICYRGPTPVKFGIDFKRKVAWDKHRFHIQLVFCPSGYGRYTIPSKPRTWTLEASNNKNAPDDEWVTIQEVVDIDPDEIYIDSQPPDGGIPSTSARGPWLQGEVLDLYRYYRFNIKEVWTKADIVDMFSQEVVGKESCHLSEIDFTEHRSAAGIFPTVISSNLFVDKLKSVTPDEHLKGESTIFYALSFDEGASFKVWDEVDWKTIAFNDAGVWKYLNKDLGYSTAESNNVRKALWHAFSVAGNRMQSSDLANIPEDGYSYTTATISGAKFYLGAGLMSTGKMEAMLKGINIRGNIYDPSGETEPQEITFSGGQSGCLITAGNKVQSDWMNFDVLDGYDLLFVTDINENSNVISKFDYDAPMIYFERPETVSYNLKDVDINIWTRVSGVILLDSVDVRQHDYVTFTVSGNSFSIGDYVRICGTEHYDYNDISLENSTLNTVSIESKHWTETPPSGSYIVKRMGVGAGYEYYDVQEGSLIEFQGAGTYEKNVTQEINTPSGLYFVTDSSHFPGYKAWNLFDNDEKAEYHSGKQIDLEPVYIGLELKDAPRSFYKFRVKSSSNEVFWKDEFPKEIQFSYSSESAPTLTNEAHWVELVSGTCGIPSGPKQYGSWEEFTWSGSAYHFRFKIDSNYGGWSDCIRISEIQVEDEAGALGGYTVIYPSMGTNASHLFDGSSFSQFVSQSPTSTPSYIAVDNRNNKKSLEQFRIKSVSHTMTDQLSGIGWKNTYPKDISVYGSNENSPDIAGSVGWDLISSFSLSLPVAVNTYGDWVDVNSTLPYRHYRFKITSAQGGTSKYVEMSDMELNYVEGAIERTTVNYDDTFPVKLIDLPKNHEITKIVASTDTGMYGGYTEQVGITATGVENVSFVTMVDRNNRLDNGKAISHIGIYAEYSSEIDITFKMFKALNPPTYDRYDIENIVTVTHSGTGFQWFELSVPEVVDSDGEWYLGWYQPEYPVTMGIYDASPKVNFEYGDRVSTNITLQETSNFRPSLAFRYAGFYTIGLTEDNDYFKSTFSPVNLSQEYLITQQLGPLTSGISVYIYQPCTFIQADTQGQLSVDVYYQDVYAETYGLERVTITDSAHYDISAGRVENLFDGDDSTYFHSYRELDETQHLFFTVRFTEPIYMNAMRLQSYNGTGWGDRFPDAHIIRGTNDYDMTVSLLSGDELYKDEGLPLPPDKAEWSPWVYYDFYDNWYKYFKFDLYHWEYEEELATLSDFEFRYTISGTVTVTGTNNVNALQNITTSGGQHNNGLKLLYPAGNERIINYIYNTYTSYGVIESSPGGYFYRGQNNLELLNDNATKLYKEYNGDIEEIEITYPEFAGMKLLAWHSMNESFGNYEDRSGHGRDAIRVGNVLNVSGRRGGTQGARIDGDGYGYARFTLPHRLSDYTVCFWFKPDKDITEGSTYSFDIMGGWTSYGAIPGNWHISLGRSFLHYDTPYPSTQIKDWNPPEDDSLCGCLHFGNYGGYVRTSRNFFSREVWYHIAFGFNSSGPYRVWINGFEDVGATWVDSNVYPPSEVIMVDPDDIHYSDYSKSNCTYFGLPMKDTLGARGEFSISDVMHFGKLLNSDQVFDIFRLKQDLSEDWSALYFADTEEFPASSKLIIDYGQELPINKYGFIPASESTTSGVSWKLTGSGIISWEVLDERYNDIASDDDSEYITETYYVSATDDFPQFLFNMPVSKEVIISWEVEEPYYGGYKETVGRANNPDSFTTAVGGKTFINDCDFGSLEEGRYITRAQVWGETSYRVIDWIDLLIAHKDYNWRYDVIKITRIYDPGRPSTVMFTPIKIPGPDYFMGECVYTSGYGFVQHEGYDDSFGSSRKNGCSNIGDNIGGWYYDDDVFASMKVSYANLYSIGVLDESEMIFDDIQPFDITESGSINVTVSSSRAIYMHRDFVVADTQGRIKITVKYKDLSILPSVTQWYNLYNKELYRYYAIEFDNSSSSLSLAGIATRSTPELLTVSGSYYSTTSGINVLTSITDQVVAGLELGSTQIEYEASRDSGVNWYPVPSGICEWESIGSGNVYIKSKFTTIPEYYHSSVLYYGLDTTDWKSNGYKFTVYFNTSSGCTITGGTTKESDWLHYKTSNDSYHIVDMELDASSDRVAYDVEGYGALIGNYSEDLTSISGFDYSCSGIRVISSVLGRNNEVIRLSVSGTDNISIGDSIRLWDYLYTDYYQLIDFSINTIDVMVPHPYTSISGYYNRRVTPDTTISGADVQAKSMDTYISSINNYTVILEDALGSQYITAISPLTTSPSGLVRTTVTGVASAMTASGWSYSYLGRVSSIDVNSSEPSGTFICHGVSFDGQNSFYVYENQVWVQVAKLDGQWKYYNDGWYNSTNNDALSAFKQAVEDGGYLFLTSEIEAVSESEWHEAGAVQVTSGTLDFIQVMYGDVGSFPTISGYNINFVQRNGISELIPTDYGYDIDAGYDIGGILHHIKLEPDTYKEIWYDRKYIDHIRLYVVNDDVADVSLKELVLFDYQVPDDSYYLSVVDHETKGIPTYNTVTGDRPYLNDGLLYTGGAVILEQDTVSFKQEPIPVSKGLYFGEIRVYYDTAQHSPDVVSITTNREMQDYVSNCPGSPQYSTVIDSISGTGYVGVNFFDTNPITEVNVVLENTNQTGSGICRITEIRVDPLYNTSGWNIPDEFNLLESSMVVSNSYVDCDTLTPIPMMLATPQLERLVDTSISGALPIFQGYTIDVTAKLENFTGKTEEIRAYTSRYEDTNMIFYTQTSGLSSWSEREASWTTLSGQGYFYYTFEEPNNVTALRVYCENTSSGTTEPDLQWLRGIHLLNSSSGIDFGTTGTSGNTLDLKTYYRDYERIAIYNNSPFKRPANARILPRYSNDYDLDRTIQTSSYGNEWRGLEDGIRIPEDYPYEMGQNSGVYISSNNKIKLNSGVTSGNWVSPIIETLDPSSTAAYVYTNNVDETDSYVNINLESVSNLVEVRASNTKPMHIFMVTALDTVEQYPAPWKTVCFDSTGSLVSWTRSSVTKTLNRGSLSDPEGAPARYWYMAYQPLWQFWGCLEPSGRGAICMGLEYVPPSMAGAEYEDRYTIRRVFPQDADVTSADGEDASYVHIYETNYYDGEIVARIVPIFNRVLRHVERYQGSNLRKSWQMLDIVYRSDPFFELYQEEYFSDKKFHLRSIFSYEGTSATPEDDNEIDYLYSFDGSYEGLVADQIRCAACIDGYAGGLYAWVHFAIKNSYYRTLLVSGTSVVSEFTGIEKAFNFMCEGAPGFSRGFWGITNTAVAWYEYDGSNLSEVFSVFTDGSKNFSYVTHGAVDGSNNLWFLDLPTERVIRVNFSEQVVDYSREVRGVASVYPDPHDGSAYVYVIRDPEFPNGDCVKIIHASGYDYPEPEVVCEVPGVALVEPFNVRLIGRSLHPDEDYGLLPHDPVWGESSSLPWRVYSAGSPTLPKQQYKQFRLTLHRNDSNDDSPEIDKIRIPKPSVINKIPYLGYEWIYIDTIDQDENTALVAGNHTADLLVWWVRE